MTREERKKYIREIHEKIAKILDPNKDVCFRFHITDCEHEGDVSRAEYEVSQYIKDMGGEITDSYWDGHDCSDDAYVECRIPYNYDNVMKLLDSGEFTDPWQE